MAEPCSDSAIFLLVFSKRAALGLLALTGGDAGNIDLAGMALHILVVVAVAGAAVHDDVALRLAHRVLYQPRGILSEVGTAGVARF